MCHRAFDLGITHFDPANNDWPNGQMDGFG
jgi:hypothetical protein